MGRDQGTSQHLISTRCSFSYFPSPSSAASPAMEEYFGLQHGKLAKQPHSGNWRVAKHSLIPRCATPTLVEKSTMSGFGSQTKPTLGVLGTSSGVPDQPQTSTRRTRI